MGSFTKFEKQEIENRMKEAEKNDKLVGVHMQIINRQTMNDNAMIKKFNSH